MTEASSLWRRAREGLAPYGFFHRVESRLEPGTPDVFYAVRAPGIRRRASGVIELKWRPDLPARSETPLRWKSLTLDQVLFAEAWERAGGDAWLLGQAGRRYFLFRARSIRPLFEGAWTVSRASTEAAVVADRFPALPVVRALCGEGPLTP